MTGPADTSGRGAADGVLRVGLTGNIAAGKSTVAAWLAGLGCHVVDADALGRLCLQPGQPAHARVVAAFGEEVVDDDGGIDRAVLGRIVFADADARARLEAILHPCIRERESALVADFARAVGRGVAVTEAALLFETGGADRYDRMVVVVAPDPVRLDRLLERSMSEGDARRRMAAQMDQDEKARRADYVVDNGGELAATREQVERLYRQLLDDLDDLLPPG